MGRFCRAAQTRVAFSGRTRDQREASDQQQRPARHRERGLEAQQLEQSVGRCARSRGVQSRRTGVTPCRGSHSRQDARDAVVKT
jgi:hypothetical protein